jgi:signal transduction histidine kinase
VIDFFRHLLMADFMPHGHCYFWKPEIVWLHVASDAVIALSYYSIPFVLLYFARRRSDLPFPWMFLCFGAFILACGTTHVLNILTLWVPVYRLDGLVKLLTATLSIVTAVLLYPLVPKALALPHPADLQREIGVRRQAEADVRKLNTDLEQLVAERTKELTRSNEDLGSFARAASHDLQDPLRTVISHTQILDRKYGQELPDDAKELIHFTVDAAARMRAMIDDLLEYSRMESARMQLEPVDCNGAVAAAIANLNDPIAKNAAIVESSQLPTVMGTRSQLTRVFQNLAGNAIKYRSEAPPRIEISARQSATEWIFRVRDNGIGIDPAYAEKIFVVFQRLHGSEIPGTGLGLSICQRIIIRHGGTIWVESELGKGSSFYFTLPT